MKKLLKILIWPFKFIDSLFTPEFREADKHIQKLKDAHVINYEHFINIR